MGPHKRRRLARCRGPRHLNEKTLEDLGKRAEIHIYPGADHAFFNDTRPEVYNEAAARDAWNRTITFLRAELKPKT